MTHGAHSNMTLLARLIISFVAVSALLAGLLPFAPVPDTHAAETVPLPFPGGQAVRIIQGYNGGTHQGRSHYGLDLVLAGGGTSGAEVVSPIDGSVTWAYAPGRGNGCMSIALRDGSYSVTLCHVIFPRAYRPGESIARGQSLGTVGPSGTIGNNGTPHVHMELHRRGRGPVPFAPPDGLPLEGLVLPASGAYNEHSSRTPIVSTNGPGSGTRPAGAQPEQPRTGAPAGGASSQPRPTPTPAPRPTEAPPKPAPQQQQPAAAPAQPEPPSPAPAPPAPAATPATGDQSVQPSSPEQGAARPAPPARAALVRGTGACLNVREQPSVEAPLVDCLPDGTEVALTGAAEERQDYRWRQLEGLGWAVDEYLERTRAVVAGTDSCLNVRAQPSTAALVVGCLPEGTSLAIVEGPTSEQSFDWYRIGPLSSVPEGGWVVGQYLD